MQKKKSSIYLKFRNVRKLRPDLSGNPFFCIGKRFGKKKIENGRRNLAPKKLNFILPKAPNFSGFEVI